MTAKEILREKLEKGYQDYLSEFQQYSKNMDEEDLIAATWRLFAGKQIARKAVNSFRDEEAAYMIKFLDPLTVLFDEFDSSFDFDFVFDDVLDHAVWRLLDTRDADDDYPLDPAYSADHSADAKKAEKQEGGWYS